ncbi:TolC family protein [Geobacter sp.]|uniref:TolC family protein n=1 Tax=Geobacter sp. TaxID=46610 RepID=UPI002621D5E4|nr:TolC family protein [Geobacter sp.]
MEFALQNNGDLKALREERGVREAGKIRAGLYPNPVLDLDGTTGELSGSSSENRLSIGISQEFLTMGKRGKRQLVAEKELEGFDRQIDNSGRLLKEEVKTTFYDLLLAEKRVELAERSIALNNQLLEVTKQRLAAGDIPELEVNLARVEVARSEGRKIEAERELFPAKARLIALLGLSPGEAASFSGSLEGKPFTKSLEKLKGVASLKRPDLGALAAERAKSDAEIALARAERIPNVTAGLGYQRENTAIPVAGIEAKDRDNLIGLKLSVPIPLFDRNQAGIREARARKGSAENRYLFARKVVDREVEAAYSRLTTAEKALAIYGKEIIPQLEENLKLVQEAYRLGEVGILTVIEEQKKFFEVNDGYLAALYNHQTALVKLEAAVGAALE